ncbi:MAG: BamA/TamA family outer membrane protein [Bacteroidetes bacterium]|nr:BamA/TamA family outer membrane protein [Bacteroidota bacterium]MDA0937363.1 BamA/TamA family outer membrane protein [Bacteroidota bacterium]MDA1344769.1 BamA/TamA family outer membrane protein [Bacteroidota bacterium]
MRHLPTKLSILGLSSLLFFGCSGIKKLQEHDQLLTQNTVLLNGKKLRNHPVKKIISPQPNTTLFKIPVKRNLYLSAQQNPDSLFEVWLNKKPQRKKRLENLWSAKQIEQLRKYKIGWHQWLVGLGEPPALIDTLAVLNSQERIGQYYKNRGYFNATTTHTILPKSKQKASITYAVQTGPQYILDAINFSSNSDELEALLEDHRDASFLVPGAAFKIKDFESERERLTALLQNNGVYNFQQNSLNFKAAIDSSEVDLKVPVQINIDDYINRAGDRVISTPYTLSRIKKIDLYILNPKYESLPRWDSLSHEGVTIFYKGKLSYRPQALTDAIFISKDSLYSEQQRNLTYRYFNQLRNFKYPSIVFDTTDNPTALETTIYLNPKERFSLGLDLDLSHSNIQDFGIGSGISLAIRNLFKSTDVLELSLKNTLGSSKNAANPNDRFFNLFELGVDAKLKFPKILVPFESEGIIPKTMNPQTDISLGTSLQKNIGLDKQYFGAGYALNWAPTRTTKIQLQLLDVEYINNQNVDNYFNVYKNSYERLNSIAKATEDTMGFTDPNGDLIIPDGANQFLNAVLNQQTTIAPDQNAYIIANRIRERQERLTLNNFIMGSALAYTRNTQVDLLDENFSQFRFKIEWVGNLLMGLFELTGRDKNENNQYTIEGVVPSQYLKTEFDYIKHIRLGTQRVLALRFFSGFALPYNNATNIPFSRSYFGGGANDNRAWRPYRLGPGKSNNINEFNEANFKLAANIEYRFPILGSLKGALFVDAGNIWNALDDVSDPLARFDGWRDLEDIAVGSGIGFRYDFDFFVFRFDTAFKTYNPARPRTARWWSDYALNRAVFNVGINYPF